MTSTKSTTKSTTKATASRGRIAASWRVFGNRKSNRVFTAELPAKVGQPGTAVELVSKAGAITHARLVEIHSVDRENGTECWTIEREQMTPEQIAANRAAKEQARAAYWQSDRGVETARKIQERAARKATDTDQDTDQDTATRGDTQGDTPTVSPTSAALAMAMAQMVEHMSAAGVDPAVIAATLAAMAPGADNRATTATRGDTQGDTTATKPATKAPRKPRTTKPAAKPATKPAPTMTKCAACGTRDADHMGTVAGMDSCTKCATLDGDTFKVRAIRTAAKAAK